MSPPATTPLGIPRTDCHNDQNLKSSDNFKFSASSDAAAGFNFSKIDPQIPKFSGRLKPRLTKLRRKQVGDSRNEKISKNDLDFNLFNDASGEVKLDSEMGNLNRDSKCNSGSNVRSKSSESEGNSEKFGGSNIGEMSFKGELHGSGVNLCVDNKNSLFGSCTNSSNLNATSDNGAFVFGATNSSNLNSISDNATFIFGASRPGSTAFRNSQIGDLGLDANKSGGFVFGADQSNYSSNFSFSQKESSQTLSQSNVDEIRKSSSNSGFSFGSGKDEITSKQSSGFGNINSANFVFGANKIESSGNNLHPQKEDGGKILDKNDISSKVKLDPLSASKKVYSPRFDLPSIWSNGSTNNNANFVFGSNSSSKKSDMDLKNDVAFTNVSPHGSFVFGEPKGNVDSSINGSTKPIGEMNQIDRGNKNSIFGDDFLKGPVFNLSNHMNRLNINDSGAGDRNTKSFNCSSSDDVNNVFVFGKDRDSSVSFKENRPTNISGGTPDVSQTSQHTPESNKTSTWDFSAPNLTFSFSTPNLVPGLDKKLDKVNSKSTRNRRLNKANVKLRPSVLAQEANSKNQDSPGSGSPMDFSPYQDSRAGVKEEACDVNKKDFEGQTEKSSDEESNSYASPLLLEQDGLSTIRREYVKKYRSKFGSKRTTKENKFDKENTTQSPKGATVDEACEHWRIRGNQAYHAGEISKAEEFYSTGINLVPCGSTLKSLLLCYSNRAATRMSLGRMREAIEDCMNAAALDPSFSKVTLRAGNCHLVLGETENAIKCYNKFLESGTGLCLDRRVTIEAADGVQKAKSVENYMHNSTKLLQEGTNASVSIALGNITEALSMSRYSEKLLEMKGRALCILRRYDEVIQLCDQTLRVAQKNFSSAHVRFWRWYLQIKSHYHMGRLDLALDLTEKQENLPNDFKSGNVAQESSITLASNIRELLRLKKSGNEAFNSKRYTEAIEHYTAAISKSVESRPFMAICFCNRAAVYQSTGQIIDAIADCSLAIALDENYQKAISRRATLHEMIRDYKQAVNDVERLISLLESQSRTKTQQVNDSQNRSTARELKSARRRLSSIEEKVKKEVPMDLYLILGIKESDTEPEIKKAYRKAALKHHPDKAGQVLVRSDVDDGALWKEVCEKIHNDADRLFKIIGEAYAVLSDSSKRSEYDTEEEMRDLSRDSNRTRNCEPASTSYNSSSGDRGNFSRWRKSGFSNFEKEYTRRQYW